MDALTCNWGTAKYLIFSNNVFDPLIYYSHLTALFLLLIIGIFILTKGYRELANRILFAVSGFFAVWIFSDLVVWATENHDFTMFFWSLEDLVEPFIYAGMLYFIYVFIDKKDISLGKKIGIGALLLPTIILAPTHYLLIGFDNSNCDRDAVEGIVAYYSYLIEIVYILWVVFLSFGRYLKEKNSERRSEILFISAGTSLLLLTFSLGNLVGSLFSFTNVGYSWTIGQYGLFGVPIFVGFLGYSIVRFKTFNTKIIGTQALIFVLLFLNFALLFLQQLRDIRVIVGFTIIFTLIVGYNLIKGVRKEIEQREIITATNAQLENLLHFISHEVKGALNKSRIALSEIMDSSNGTLSPELQKMVLMADSDTKKSVEMVMNILGSADFKSGKIATTKAPFDFKGALMETVTELSIDAKAKGLSIETEIDEKDASGAPADYTINGDREQLTKHVIRNLIDNSIKYTPTGGLKVHLGRKGKNIVFTISDTGVGITPADMQRLFTEGGKGEHSSDVNVHSTGYGLFFAKSLVVNHGGRVWAESEGTGKGSQFYVELPVAL